jgi:iron complex transport system ATP-binding protein
VNIVVRDLTVRYGRIVALSGIDLDLVDGEVMGVVGPNGSGKSTLLRALAGLLAYSGRVEFGSAGRVAYMPQEGTSRSSLSVLEVVLLGRLHSLGVRVHPQDLEAARSAVEELGIAHLVNRGIGELSGGQRQMAMLAQVLVAEPGALLLDEPISALDPSHQLGVLSTIRRLARDRDIPALVVLHDLNAALRHCDRILVLDAGRRIACRPSATALPASLLADVFRIDAEICAASDGQPFIVPVRRRDAAAGGITDDMRT